MTDAYLPVTIGLPIADHVSDRFAATLPAAVSAAPGAVIGFALTANRRGDAIECTAADFLIQGSDPLIHARKSFSQFIDEGLHIDNTPALQAYGSTVFFSFVQPRAIVGKISNWDKSSETAGWDELGVLIYRNAVMIVDHLNDQGSIDADEAASALGRRNHLWLRPGETAHEKIAMMRDWEHLRALFLQEAIESTEFRDALDIPSMRDSFYDLSAT